MSEKLQQVLRTLQTRFGFEVVQPTISLTKIRVLGRIQQAQQRNWMAGVQHILLVAEKREWGIDISRQYFVRGDTLVFAWRVIIQAQNKNLEQYADDIITTFNNAPRARVELDEQALPVRGPRSTMNSRGKGASSGGSLPSILQRQVAGA